MNTYYDILEVDKEATSVQIKKAYFAMVRKYPPERFSEKFMEIRTAYEILSNEKTRAEYDNVINMPGIAKVRFDTAKELFEQGENKKAITILEELNRDFPDILMIQSLLGEAYINNNNNGKAIKIFENLVKLAPDNASFAGYLAKSYLLRGWHKKAVNGFKRAIKLDEDNLSLWMGLSEAYLAGDNTNEAKKILEELLQRKQGEDQAFAISIYFSLFMIDFKNGNLENMKENLEKLANVAIKQEDARENVAWVLFMLAKQMVEAQVFEPAKEILERAERISPDRQEIKELRINIGKICRLEGEFSGLELDDNYDDTFVGIVATKIFPTESIGGEIHIRGAEREFLENVNKYKKYVNLLSKEYPNIYEELKDFFNKAFDNRERNKMIKEHEKYFRSKKGMLELALERMSSGNISDMYDDEYDDEDEEDDFWFEPQEPYVREELKIGRNDPCPCGSGKKYKKCCGK